MNYNDETLLEMVELYAEEVGHVSTESELSERFDDMLGDDTKRKLANDPIMLSEEFSYFADALCKDGEIHPEQYVNYCYVGELVQ
jgi:hypothetical protein